MGYNKLKSLSANVQAIATAFKIRKEQRKATGEERILLQQYTGFGGIYSVLLLDNEDKDHDTTDDDTKQVLQQLKNVLSEATEGNKKLYKLLVKSIKNSVLTAFYTPQSVISAIADNIQHIFSKNNLTINTFMEPSAGIGGFLPVAPANSVKIAFEKDYVTGLILSTLEPDTQVFIDGFETFGDKEIETPVLDVIASNIPFGNLNVYDADFIKRGEPYTQAAKTIHNYFFFKAISLLKEGGILAFITSRGVADSASNKFVRDFIVHNSNLITALRLPDNLFIETGGIEVGSDLFILQKHSNKCMLTSREQIFLDTMKEQVPCMIDKSESTNKLLCQPKEALATESSIFKNQYGKYVRRYYWKNSEQEMRTVLSNKLATDFDRYFRMNLFGAAPIQQQQAQFTLFDLFDTGYTEPVKKVERGKRPYTGTITSWMKEGTMVVFEDQIGTLHFTRDSFMDSLYFSR